MINVLILAAGNTSFNVQDDSYPLCLTEFDGMPLIEKLIRSAHTLNDVNFIVALKEQDIQHYHLDNVVRLLAPQARILNVSENTQGAACTALLAAGYIDKKDELLILNGNELLDEDFAKIVHDFRSRNLDAGTVVFSSVHPRYSYVRINTESLVIEAAEKKPISRLATVGFYWFASGERFVRGVQNMIRKDASVNNLFYISPVFNELVLEQAKIGIYQVQSHQYHPFKTERQLTQYETALDQKRIL